MGSWETAHVLHMMWTLHKEWMIFCLQTFQGHVFESRKLDQRSICRTWSSSLRRVIRWKGSIRKDLRDRRWQMGSLSSFSKTSRKLLLLFLDGVGRLRCGGDGEERGLGKASGSSVQDLGLGRDGESPCTGFREDCRENLIWRMR